MVRRGQGAATVFFVSADSKGFAGEKRVSAHSKRLKVAVFSASWEGFVTADSKGVTGALSILIDKYSGTADSKGVRRTAWRGRMVVRARRHRCDSIGRLSHVR